MYLPTKEPFLTFCLIQKLCEHEWRLARLEAECQSGDGIVFRFPSPRCSPFDSPNTGIVANSVFCVCPPLVSAVPTSFIGLIINFEWWIFYLTII